MGDRGPAARRADHRGPGNNLHRQAEEAERYGHHADAEHDGPGVKDQFWAAQPVAGRDPPRESQRGQKEEGLGVCEPVENA